MAPASPWLTCHPSRCEAAGDQSITIPGDVFSRSADLAGWGPPQLRLASYLAGAAAGLAMSFWKTREVRTPGGFGGARGAPELAQLACAVTPIAGGYGRIMVEIWY